MSFFTWIVKAEDEGGFSFWQGVSPSYSPHIASVGEARKLAGSYVLIILRGDRGDVLFKKIFVNRVDELIDVETGESTGRFELSVDILKSARLAPNYRAGVELFAVDASALPFGLAEIPEAEAKRLFDVITSKISFRLATPSDQDFAFPKSVVPIALRSKTFASQTLKEVIKHHALSEIWASNEETNPFVFFAEQHIKRCDMYTEEAIWALQVASRGIFFIGEEPRQLQTPQIDLDFELIDPEQITFRKFTAFDPNQDLGLPPAKTELAERRHQDILFDISRFLLGTDREPLQSRAIDLVIRNSYGLEIFEIKTTTPENIVQQVSKGVFQLAMYSQAIRDAGLKIARRGLILEASCSRKFKEFLIGGAQSLGIDLLLYDSTKEWPERLSQLL